MSEDQFTKLFKYMEKRFDDVDGRFDKVDERIDRLVSSMDGFVKILEDERAENAARDAQFERLLAWARKVSDKTGVPLEGF